MTIYSKSLDLNLDLHFIKKQLKPVLGLSCFFMRLEPETWAFPSS